MPRSRQVGGMQEVFIQTNNKSLTNIDRTIKAVEKLGGRVVHVYPPGVMVASVPSNSFNQLKGKAGIVLVQNDVFSAKSLKEANHELKSAFTIWNDHISEARRTRRLASPDLDKSWDTGQRKPPDPPKEVLEELRRREAELAPKRRAAVIEGAPNMSIPVLVGRIAVGVIWVDSTVPAFAISNDEKLKTLTEITEGLNLLAGFEPRANLQWFYDFKRPKLSLTATQGSNEDLWRNAAMSAIGYSANLAGMNAYINSIKTKYNADWAYALFITKYPKSWFAYYWGNHVVMDFGVDGWGIDNFHIVLAHETGHVFGCGDEYASSGCTCSSLHGRYQVSNGNCENCASPFIPCLMAHNTAAVCDYTRGQLGWNELAVQSKGTTVLKGTWTFDFDGGIQGPASGADIWWEQVNTVVRYLVPQSGAMLAHMGKPNFDAVSYQTLKGLSYTATPIVGSNNRYNKLTAGTVIAIKTGSGRYAKMKINSYGYNLNITWVTYK